MRMESAKMVLMNLLEGQQWRGRHREQTEGKKRVGELRAALKHTYICKTDSQWEFAV